ncbi:MAG TPA: hypothetical protein VGR61_02655 [Candidatus Dormibacteraeota bacterium]|nr:hypothetical protein [Candidatus Dormibacteraeota bacterium]
MATGEITVDWLREVLVRHDPLGVWQPAGTYQSDYTAESEKAVAGMRRVLGLGHIWTLVADAIDASHPGFYRAARTDQGDLRRSLALIARDAWDQHSWIVPGGRTPLAMPDGPLPPAPTLISEPATLSEWLRHVEVRLEAESDQTDRNARVTPPAFRAALPDVVMAYAAASEQQREDTRLAFSRYIRVRYELAGFAGEQLARVEGDGGEIALRRALLAESLLDQGLDWRDELLLLRDLRERARAAGLPFNDLLAEAAACSNERTADFLLQVVREAPA